MQGVPVPPAGGLGGPPYGPGCDAVGLGDVLQYQQPGSTPNSAVAAGRVEVF